MYIKSMSSLPNSLIPISSLAGATCCERIYNILLRNTNLRNSVMFAQVLGWGWGWGCFYRTGHNRAVGEERVPCVLSLLPNSYPSSLPFTGARTWNIFLAIDGLMLWKSEKISSADNHSDVFKRNNQGQKKKTRNKTSSRPHYNSKMTKQGLGDTRYVRAYT